MQRIATCVPTQGLIRDRIIWQQVIATSECGGLMKTPKNRRSCDNLTAEPAESAKTKIQTPFEIEGGLQTFNERE